MLSLDWPPWDVDRLLEKQKAIELEEHEVTRRTRELEATVKRPAEAMAVQARLEADADAYRKEGSSGGLGGFGALRGAERGGGDPA